MAEDAGGEGEVVGGGLVAVDGATGGGDGELGVQGGEVEEDVEELVLYVVAGDGAVGIVA